MGETSLAVSVLDEFKLDKYDPNRDLAEVVSEYHLGNDDAIVNCVGFLAVSLN